MAVIERDVVLTSKDADGNNTIDLPVTRLGLIENEADVKASPADTDYIPVMDSADNGQMKKTSVNTLFRGVQAQLESLAGAFVEEPFTIPVNAWTVTSGRYGFYADVTIVGAGENCFPSVMLDEEGQETAFTCGFNPNVSVSEGKLRLKAQVKPTKTVSGVCVLWRTGSSGTVPVATSNTVGGIKGSDSILIDTDGTAHAQLGSDSFVTDAEFDAALNDIYGV